MIWLIPAILAGGLIAAGAFAIATDGRYFGKRLVYWVYDTFGPALFSSQSESDRWRALAGMIGLKGGESILDVGTAVGDLPMGLAAMPGFHGRAVGVDWSPHMVERANAESARRGLADRVRFQVVDARQGLPFGDGEFDVVVCMGLLETLPGPQNLLGELCRVLSAGGVLVVSVYRGSGAVTAALSRSWYETHLGGLGWGDIEVVQLRRTQDVLIARRGS